MSRSTPLAALRRGHVLAAARVAAVAGLSLTLAGAHTPSATAVAGAGPGAGSLRHLLNPSGAERQDDPAEAAAGQQAFASRHFGAMGLAAPYATSTAIQNGITQAAAVPTSATYGHNWTIRGPKSYFA